MKNRQRIRVTAPSQSAAPPIQVKSLQSRPFAPTPNPANVQQAVPSIQAQLDGARRFGYDLSNISVFPTTSAAVQPKLTVGQPGDKYEQEADQVATDVVNRMNTPASQTGQGEIVQRNETEHETNQEVQFAKTPATLPSKLSPVTGILQCGQLTDQEREAAKSKKTAASNFWQNLKNQTPQDATNSSNANAQSLGVKSTSLKKAMNFWQNTETHTLKEALSEAQKKSRFNRQDKDVDSATKEYYKAIEKGISKDYAELDEIAVNSVYKNLKRVGEDSKHNYSDEYKSSGDIAEGTINTEITRLKKERDKLAEIEQQKQDISQSDQPDKQQQIEELTKEENTIKLAIKNYEDKLKDQEIDIDLKTLKLDSSQFKKYKVDYLTEPERKNFSLDIRGGTIYQKNNKYDTANSFTLFSGRGTAIYVMDPNGKFYAGPHKVGRFHHSSFLAGGSVAGAGEMKVTDGKLEKISNKSGHYTPNDYQVLQTLMQLEKQGINLNIPLELIGSKKEETAFYFLKNNQQKLESINSSVDENTIKEFRALGLYFMNGQWRNNRLVLDRSDVKTANKIVKQGGAKALEGLGAVLDSKDKSWKTVKFGLNLSLDELLQALENSEYIKEKEKQEEHERKLKEEFDSLAGEDSDEALKNLGLEFDDEGGGWKIPDTEIEVELANQIRLLKNEVNLEELKKELGADKSEESEDEEPEESEDD